MKNKNLYQRKMEAAKLIRQMTEVGLPKEAITLTVLEQTGLSEKFVNKYLDNKTQVDKIYEKIKQQNGTDKPQTTP